MAISFLYGKISKDKIHAVLSWKQRLIVNRVSIAQFPSGNGMPTYPPEENFGQDNPQPEPEKIARYLVLSAQKWQRVESQKITP